MFDMKHPTHIPQSVEGCMRIDTITCCVNEEFSEPVVITQQDTEEETDECHFAVYQIADDNEYEADPVNRQRPVVELKPLPAHLKYVYLGREKSFQ